MAKKTLHINAVWDTETHLWVATCDELPDFEIKASSYDDLVLKTTLAVRELLRTNAIGDDDQVLH
jgi:hypothetical protein